MADKGLLPSDVVMAMLTSCGDLSAAPNTAQCGSMKRMKIFEEDGHEATVSKVNNNLVGRGCIAMLGKNEITGEICNKGLAYLMFLKQKGIKKVKARGCVDRRPQKEYVSKGDSSLATVSIYALIAQCVMNAI